MNQQTKPNMDETTIIFGRSSEVMRIAKERNTPEQTQRYGDGQVVQSPIKSFEGGYDDYDGAMAWAEVPGTLQGTMRRFSPCPGKWMSGIRV